jgi:PAS domain-containing protein
MRPPAAPAVYTAPSEMEAPTLPVQSVLPANLDKSFTSDFSMLYDPSLFGGGIQNQPHYAQFASEQATSEFLVLSDFLNIMGSPTQRPASPSVPVPVLPGEATEESDSVDASRQHSRANSVTAPNSQNPSKPGSVNGISESAQEKFFLTAADPNPESAEDRLKSVINAKVEAGLMKPFNYVRGYARLQKFMDANMSAESKQRILAPLSTFRPAFRAIAKRLTDVDLILVEEAFERLLLDYDRVFTSISVPACLWRRTGEIFRGNKEFAALLNIPAEHLRDGKLAITELMAEDSAVNYWEKYGNIAFDGAQKAVLTSCLLQLQRGEGVVSCCFSFTIKRDRYNIPSCIVGNFIPVKLS